MQDLRIHAISGPSLCLCYLERECRLKVCAVASQLADSLTPGPEGVLAESSARRRPPGFQPPAHGEMQGTLRI